LHSLDVEHEEKNDKLLHSWHSFGMPRFSQLA